MTDRQYLRHLLKLTIKISDACNTHGYGSDAYNAVLKEIAHSALKFNRSRSRRRRPWIVYFVVISAIVFVAYLVYLLLSELKI